jgi:uncharacterized protein (TIGR03790 family)
MRKPTLFPILLVLLSGPAVAGAGRVLVVINDDSEESRFLGERYALGRGVPERNLCRIRTAPVPSLDRRTYETDIRDAVAACLRTRNLQDEILYIVTTRGVPLWIRGQRGPVGDLAAVDSELALLYGYLLGERLSPFGRHENPYFAPDARAIRPFRREEQSIYLVTRLTASSPTEGARLVDRGLVERASGAVGLDLPSQSRSYLQGWIRTTSEVLSSRGEDVQLEDTASWLEPASALLGYVVVLDPAADLATFPRREWPPGAVALVLGDTWRAMECLGEAENDASDFGVRADESDPEQPAGESGRPSESPRSPRATPDLRDTALRTPEPASTCLPFELISQGVTGVALFVEDPTQDGFPRPQVLFPSYLGGRNLAESFYLATRYLGWRQVVLGDPLARVRPSTVAESDWEDRIDPATGLPRLFAERRLAMLQRRHATSPDAVRLLLRAEGLLARGDESGALADLAECLRRDASIGEARLLQARLFEKMDDVEAAVVAFEDALRIRAGDEGEIRAKLAQLALHRLEDPSRAEPHAHWLFARSGFADMEATRLWAEVKLRMGDLDRAEALYLRLARERTPPPGFALEGLGRVYEMKGDSGLAERFLRRALDAEDVDRAAVESRLAGLGVKPTDILAEEGPAAEKEPKVAADEGTVVGPPPEGETSTESADGMASGTRRARVVHRIPPEYPVMAQREGTQGRVVLRLLIDERGQLLKMEALTGDRRLIQAAERAVRQWTFAPRLVDGRPEIDSIVVAVDFRLGENREE